MNPIQVDSSVWGSLDWISVAPPKLLQQQHLLPRIIRLAGLSDERRLQLLEAHCQLLAKEGRILWSCVLQTDASLESVAMQMARNMVLTTPHGQKFLLRFFDPRVFRHLIWIFTPRQMASFVGQIAAWYWVDVETKDWRRTIPSHDEPAERLSAEQWGSLHRIGLLNLTLADIRRMGSVVEHDEKLYRDIDAGLRRAIEVEGLVDAEDQRLYAVHCLQHGIQWGERPEVRSVLKRVRSGAGSYFALSTEIKSSGASRTSEELEGNLYD